MSNRIAYWVAWALWLLVLGMSMLVYVLSAMNGNVKSPPLSGAMSGIAIVSVGALIVSRRPSNRIGWLLILATLLLAFGGEGNFADQYAIYTLATRPGALPAGPWVLWFKGIAQILGFFPLVSFLLLLFPDGRSLSARWRLVAWLAIVFMALAIVVNAFDPQPLHVGSLEVPNPLGIEGARVVPDFVDSLLLLSGLALALTSVASVFLRFRRARGDERQQLKWLFYGALFIPLALVSGVLSVLLNLTWVLNLGLWQLSVAGIPLAIGIAILKYRLYDIDIIIRRTVIYTLLTLSLAIVYFGSVVVLQQLFRAITGAQQSEIVTVISTLAIAALFVPLRQRIQRTIDRRFYRRKYDAAQVLAAFSATARDEVDLNKLTERLLDVVDETMQPAQMSLWLRPAEREVKR